MGSSKHFNLEMVLFQIIISTIFGIKFSSWELLNSSYLKKPFAPAKQYFTFLKLRERSEQRMCKCVSLVQRDFLFMMKVSESVQWDFGLHYRSLVQRDFWLFYSLSYFVLIFHKTNFDLKTRIAKQKPQLWWVMSKVLFLLLEML